MKVLMRALAMAAAVTAVCAPAWAQDEDDEFAAAEAADNAEASGEKAESAEAAPKSAPETKTFTSLPFCRLLEGAAQVLKPGATEWEAIEEGRFYQLGSSFRTTDNSELVIQFGEGITVGMKTPASFATRVEPIGEKSRAVILKGGVIDVKTPTGTPDGAISVIAPGFKVVNLAGFSRYAYKATEDGDAAKIRCVTGTIRVEGRHYTIPVLKAAEEIKIRADRDQLFTGIYGLRGKANIELDQGLVSETDFTTGEVKVSAKPLVWKLTPRTSVKISRALPAIGERMSVSVMTFDTKGFVHDRCAFVEGRAELAVREYSVAKAGDENARKAAAAASAVTTVEVEPEIEEDGGEGGESADSAASEDSSDSASSASSSDDDDFGF